MKISLKTRVQLPILSEKIQRLAYAVAKMPDQAAREMVLAVQFDHRRQVDPYGTPHPPTQEGRRFDAQRHVRDSWYPVVDGTDAIIESEHRATRPLQRPYKGRPQRLMHPIEGRGIGTWQKRIERMHRRLIHGAVMGSDRREATKQAAAVRRMVRFEKRNADRVARGLKPLRPRAVRSDRARVDALVVRSRGGADA